MSYTLWRILRSPFRVPRCTECAWECFDSCQAGCLRCGAHHVCASNAVESTCPLVLCDDGSRVCSLTGLILSEVLHSENEFLDTVVYRPSQVEAPDIEGMVYSTVYFILNSPASRECVSQENSKAVKRLNNVFFKFRKEYKTRTPKVLPNLCQVLAATMSQLSNIRLMEQASSHLIDVVYNTVVSCILQLGQQGLKISNNERIREIVTGLLFLLRSGLVYNNQVLLPCIPELSLCLPNENKLEVYFKISSKVVTSVENLIKLTLRDKMQ